MITVHVLSPQNELRAAERLRDDVVRAWPDLVDDPASCVDLLVGVRAGVDCDLLIAIDLAEPRMDVSSGLIAVEIKQLDASRFERRGTQLHAVYHGRTEQRSVADQARDAAHGIRQFAQQSFDRTPFVYALAWLTEVDEAKLTGVDPAVLGRRADWFAVLRTALLQNPQLSRPDVRTRDAVRSVRDRLMNRRVLSTIDRARAERIARDAVKRDFVNALAPVAGTKAIQLAGHGGSGKTTLLVLLAIRLATAYKKRVLILTFHQALRNDIRDVIAALPDGAPLLRTQLAVETATGLLIDLVKAAGGTVPYAANGAPEYDKLEPAFAEVAQTLAPDPTHVALVKKGDELRFDWDAVLVDEAQDWLDAERDLLLATYGHRALVLADGLTQLIRRQTPCNWMRHVPAVEREMHLMDTALRQKRNVADFTNAVASALGFADWAVEPHPQLTGGRVILLEGPLPPPARLLELLESGGDAGHARPVDNLICVPPSAIEKESGGTRRARIAEDLRALGEAVWDASDPLVRATSPPGPEAWRVVQYHSCRGLEGWSTLLVALDDLYANALKHPNVHASDPDIAPDLIARRWLLIPLTRAVHLLIVHVNDPASPAGLALRAAANAMPPGVVERTLTT